MKGDLWAAADRIGAFRVWMDAHGIAVLVLAKAGGHEVILAGSCLHPTAGDDLAGALPKLLKPGQVVAAFGAAPQLAATLHQVADDLGATFADLPLRRLGEIRLPRDRPVVSRPALHH